MNKWTVRRDIKGWTAAGPMTGAVNLFTSWRDAYGFAYAAACNQRPTLDAFNGWTGGRKT